jgi:integral membrane protein (TIGR03766 family)
MEKGKGMLIKKILLELGNAVIFILAGIWLFFTLQSAGLHTEKFDHYAVNASLVLIVLCLIGFLFREKTIIFLKNIKTVFLKYKFIFFAVVIIFQITLALTSSALPVADATAVFQLAVKDPQATLNYISVNPNNFALLVWYKIIFFFFGKKNLILMLVFCNIFFMDIAIFFMYQFSKANISQKIADNVYILSFLLLGLSPQFLNTYSDCIAIFLVSLVMFCGGKTFSKKDKSERLVWSIATGVALGYSYLFRPPTLIFIVALIIVAIIFHFSKRNKQFSRKKTISVMVIIISFLSIAAFNKVFINVQNFVPYNNHSSRTMTYYLDLGLTYGGGEHVSLPDEVILDVSPNRNEVIKKDIKRRMNKYTPKTFVKHLYYKYYLFTNEGMLGWNWEKVLQEKNLQRDSFAKNIVKSDFAKKVRKIVYAQGKHYPMYAFLMQIIWITVVIGLVLSTFFFNEKSFIFSWMTISLFGGLLFLLIFEGGRSRYLIQFLPAIFILSAQGYDGIGRKKIKEIKEMQARSEESGYEKESNFKAENKSRLSRRKGK